MCYQSVVLWPIGNNLQASYSYKTKVNNYKYTSSRCCLLVLSINFCIVQLRNMRLNKENITKPEGRIILNNTVIQDVNNRIHAFLFLVCFVVVVVVVFGFVFFHSLANSVGKKYFLSSAIIAVKKQTLVLPQL